MIHQRFLVLLALSVISVSGCMDSGQPPETKTNSSTSGPSASANSTTTGLPPVASNETIRHFEETYPKSLSQTRSDRSENLATSNNCVFIRTEKPLRILRGEVRAEWEPQSPLTETLVAKVNQVPELAVVASEPQQSPLAFSFENLTPLDEHGHVSIWLELAGPGAALDQAFTMTLSFDYVSEGPPTLWTDGNCA
jgi:hypothetical protein